MSANHTSILDQYLSGTKRPQETVDLQGSVDQPGAGSQTLPAGSSLQPYQAFTPSNVENQNTRLRIEMNDLDRTRFLLSKAYLVEVIMSADQFVAFIFTTAAFMIQGEHLSTLFDRLDMDSLTTIACFNANYHRQPGEGEPIINSIQRISPQEAAGLIEIEEVPPEEASL